jgi:formylglycine-generating enzyme required for sulfatase activity
MEEEDGERIRVKKHFKNRLFIAIIIMIIAILLSSAGLIIRHSLLNLDSDGDGVRNRDDEFPDDAAASIDDDGDGYPDEWNEGRSELDSTTGLTLDIFPDHSDLHSIDDIGLDFLEISPGSFEMGSRYKYARSFEGPIHNVTITDGFELMSKEVTRYQWNLIINNIQINSSLKDHPKANLSWYDCFEFIEMINEIDDEHHYRLPTEAEWEYCCRAGSTSLFCFGDSPENLSDYGWYNVNSNISTHAVGLKKPNAWGLYDMHGNVWEWCNDWFSETYYEESPTEDPQGPSEGEHKVVRGGSWISYYFVCSSGRRAVADDLEEGWGHNGFRIVRTTIS